MVDPEMIPLVIDCGSRYMKCGYSGDDAPRDVFPTIVGRSKICYAIPRPYHNDCFVGDEAQAKRGILKLKYPIEHGMVTNWNDMEKIWNHAISVSLRATPEGQPILLTEAPLNPKNNREKMTSIMFENYQFPAFYVGNQSVLSLFATGKTIGCVLDSGGSVTHAVPIYEGFALPRATLRMNLGGADVKEYLVKILGERNIEMTTSAEREIVRDFKEKLCYVAFDYDAEMTKAETTSRCEVEYELPDKSKMKVGDQRFRAPEIMFKPNFIGYEISGIHETVFNSICKCDKDLWRDLYPSIVLSGGNTMFEGIVERLSDEIHKLAPRNSKVKVISPAERKINTWIGGSIITCMDFFRSWWITKDEYDDFGAGIVHRKCF